MQDVRMRKKLKPSDEIVESLINLRDELFSRKPDTSEEREIFFKINSCLFGTYPIVTKTKELQ